jgi:pyruvate formate lyase activating enzyme
MCGVRSNDAGLLRLLVYGKAVAVHIDPIEKKPLHHFLPASRVFSLGTVGCNLSCTWCQNWEISQIKHFGPEVEALCESWSPQQIVAVCVDNGIPSIAFTYNEPAIFFEYAFDTARLGHDFGLRSVFVSSGFETEVALDTIAPYLDAANVDLKAFREATYRDYCSARLEPVKRNIEHLVRGLGIWTEVTTLVIPGLNDSPQELEQIAGFLASISLDIPWHVSAFHPSHAMRDRPATPARTLRLAWDIGKAAGLHYVYIGNVWGDPSLAGCSNTVCPACGTTLIERRGYAVRSLWQEQGRCFHCDAVLAGVWT